MNRKLFDIGYSIINLAVLLAFGIIVARAAEAQPHAKGKEFIPGLSTGPKGYVITGWVLSPHNLPISGVTLRTDKGQTTLTDEDGYFSLEGLANGDYTLTPIKEETIFLPAEAKLVVPPNTSTVKFSALLWKGAYPIGSNRIPPGSEVSVILRVMPQTDGKLIQIPR